MRFAYDAANAAGIPDSANAENVIVIGYANGRWPWSAADWARFPKATRLRIDVTGEDPFGTDILDVEPGNLGTPVVTPTTSPEEMEHIWAALCDAADKWVTARHNRGMQSTCYIQASRKNQLANALQGKSLFYMARWFISQAEAEQLIRGAEVCIQFEHTDAYDLSVAADNWHPVPAPAKPEPDPKPAPETPVLTGATFDSDVKDGHLSVLLTLVYSDGTEKKETY